MTPRKLLLLAYPRSWRAEYGEELAAILAQKRLGPRVALDVLLNGFKQHLERDDPWKICGVGLFLWSAIGVLAPSPWYAGLPGPVFFITGAWTVLRYRSDIRGAAGAAAKAAIICWLPDVAAILMRGPQTVQLANGAVWYQWGLYLVTSDRLTWWGYPQILASQMVLGILLGCAGGLLARFVLGFREGLRG